MYRYCMSTSGVDRNLTHLPAGFPEFDPEDVIETEVLEPPGVADVRSLVRRMAVQILYEVDSAGHPVGEVIDTHLTHNDMTELVDMGSLSTLLRTDPGAKSVSFRDLGNRSLVYLRNLVTGVLSQRERIDQVIEELAPEWPVDQIAFVDRNVLRLAIFELAASPKIPIKVVIDEAVELAKLFGAEGAPRFVNGVLGAATVNLTDRESLLAPSATETEEDDDTNDSATETEEDDDTNDEEVV